METDLHIHTSYSNDSRSKPELVVKRAIKTGLGAIAITDHNSLGGARAAARLDHGSLLVVPGAELKTQKGDLLALFVEEDIKTRDWARAIDEIRARGGISVAPHPADSPKLTNDDIRLADAAEAYNSTCSDKSNRRAAEIVAELKKPALGSSDAHLVMEVGNGRTYVQDCGTLAELRETLLENPKVSRTVRSNPLLHRMNSVVLFGLKGVWMR